MEWELANEAIRAVGGFGQGVTQGLVANRLYELVTTRMRRTGQGRAALAELLQQPEDTHVRQRATAALAADSDAQFVAQLRQLVRELQERSSERDKSSWQTGRQHVAVGGNQTLLTSGKGAKGVDLSSSVRNVYKQHPIWSLAVALMILFGTVTWIAMASDSESPGKVAAQAMNATLAGDMGTACALFTTQYQEQAICEDPEERNRFEELMREAPTRTVEVESVEYVTEGLAHVVLRSRQGENLGGVVIVRRDGGSWRVEDIISSER
jgi:hypothetical protein